jgi:hypothetical protein
MKIDECPDCSRPLKDGATKCRCGWSAVPQLPAKATPTMCSWIDHGVPCPCRGILSFGGNGAGPWYCREHFEAVQGRTPDVVGNALPPKPQSHAVREWKKAMGDRKVKQESLPNPLEAA